jgi:BirA family biotin operon repressor/biotin-[acetyl-CoA-carboxylase] ligase
MTLQAPELPPPFSLVAHDRVGSTSDEAKRLAAAGAAHGTIVWALEQTGGRGRLDRSWSSPRGNLYSSTVLRPDRPAHEAAQLGFVLALAVADLVQHFLPDPSVLALKWPNDVLVAGGKIAGILLETELKPDGRTDWLVAGIGVNLALAPTGTPYPATAIAAFRPPPSPEAALPVLAAAMLRRIGQWHEAGFAAIRRDWLDRAHPVGTPLVLRRGGDAVDGSFIDLDADGALLLGTADGVMTVAAGDVYFPAA